MPVPRRFDRSLPERDTTRVNERIRVPEVRLIGDDGNQIGVLKTADALKYAQDRELDLVEVAPDARPPVCRVLDYSKYKYEQAQRAKAARKHQQQITIREIKFRPKIDPHDYATKKGHVVRFLNGGHKVKITIMFRGREMAHTELGRKILDRLVVDLGETIVVESFPKQEGRNMIMVIGPNKRYVEAQAKEAAKLARESQQPAPEVASEEPSTEASTEASTAPPAEADVPGPEMAESVPVAETPASNDEG